MLTTALRKKPPTRLALLERLPEVAHVNADGRRRLLTVLNEVRVPAGTAVVQAGERIEHLYLVATGTVSETTSDGTLVLHGPNEPVALRALLDGDRLDGPVVAVTDVELWTMDRRAFFSACKDIPGFALGLLLAA